MTGISPPPAKVVIRDAMPPPASIQKAAHYNEYVTSLVSAG
jgi:hypothetical protein